MRGDRALQVDRRRRRPARPGCCGCSVSAMTSVLQHAVVDVGHGEADAVDGDRVAEGDVLQRPGAARIRAPRRRDWSSRTTSVPTSSTMPVNTSTPSVRVTAAHQCAGSGRSRIGTSPPRRVTSAIAEGQRVGDRGDSQVAHQGGPGAEQLRARDGSRPRRRGPSRRKAAASVGPPSSSTRRTSRSKARPSSARAGRGAALTRVGAASSRTRAVGRHPAAAVDHDPQRLPVGVAAAGVADGELRVVGERRARADDDGVAAGAQPVDGGARLGAGDPAAGAVGGGHPAVEGGGDLPDHVGPAARGTPVSQAASAPASASACSTPSSTSTPAARSRSRPPPASWVGSGTATTTRATPAAISASAQGPVRPVWAHGSRVTTAVPPRARSPPGPAPRPRRAGRRAARWRPRPPACRRRRGSPRRRRGLGLVVPEDRLAELAGRGPSPALGVGDVTRASPRRPGPAVRRSPSPGRRRRRRRSRRRTRRRRPRRPARSCRR